MFIKRVGHSLLTNGWNGKCSKSRLGRNSLFWDWHYVRKEVSSRKSLWWKKKGIRIEMRIPEGSRWSSSSCHWGFRKRNQRQQLFIHSLFIFFSSQRWSLRKTRVGKEEKTVSYCSRSPSCEHKSSLTVMPFVLCHLFSFWHHDDCHGETLHYMRRDDSSSSTSFHSVCDSRLKFFWRQQEETRW